MDQTRVLRIGVLASHEGTTLQCILDACASGRVNGCVALVISNNGNSGALRRASAAGGMALHLSSLTHEDAASLDGAIRDALLHAKVQVVLLGGYMKRLGPRTLEAFHGRILNTHPALLPKFGGVGMFGDRVFEAVLAARELESGASVHLVEADYDSGAILRQGRVPVFPGDSLTSLKARVQACERQLVVETLAAIGTGELVLEPADTQPHAADAAPALWHHAGGQPPRLKPRR